MVGVRQASNQVQKIPEFEINDRVVVQPHTWYTCPAGKKAIVKGSVVCTGRGAAATADFDVASITMFRWNSAILITATETQNYIDTPLALTTFNGGQTAFFDVELSAGDTIETNQNTGTNAEFNVFAKVQETAA